LRSWEEQRHGGKQVMWPLIHLHIRWLIYLSGIAFGLFLNIPFIRFLVGDYGNYSVAGAFLNFDDDMEKTAKKMARSIINRD
jgi:hypothetical protein